MNRRNFLHYTGLASLISTGVISAKTLLAVEPFPKFSSFEEMKNHLIELNDKRVPLIIEQQNQKPESEHFGGVLDAWKIHTPQSTNGLIKILSTAFAIEKSKYYLDSSLVEPMILAIKYLLKVQYSDGTIDLLSTNFRSTPDTAFVVEHTWFSFQMLNKLDFDKKDELLALLKEFMLKAGEAFINGGIHTPNHRWVVCQALSFLNHTFPDKRYVKRIDQWLQEGIDSDEDGQYEEKSTSIYTPLTNRCLMNIAQYNNRSELWPIIEKNLEMTMYYVHPNGEVATEAWGRQDQFRVGFMDRYYIPYMMTASRKKGNPEFWAMVDLIEKTVPEKLVTYLPYLYINPLLNSDSLKREIGSIPDNYIKEFRGSNLARIRRGNIDATILGGNPTFLTLSKGKAVLASMRMASAFFGRGQFKSKEVKRVGDSFILNWEFTWGYFQPLPDGEKANYELPFDTDRRRREKSEVQDMKGQITITEKNGNFQLEFELAGTDRVPLAIEVGFRKGGVLEGVKKSTHFENSYLFNSEKASYRFEDDVIEFGPGQADHEWTAIRGGLPKPDGDCVYITGFTPLRHKIIFS
jgi:hypothetical protein